MSVRSTFSVPWFFTTFRQPVEALPEEHVFEDPVFLHHAKTVKRLSVGDMLILVNDSEAQAYWCRCEALRRDVITVTILEPIASDARKTPNVIAAVALIKGQRWDWMLQKLTELGVSEIIPLLSERTIVDFKNPEVKMPRWEEILRSASQQSERVTLPKLHLPLALTDFMTLAKRQPNSVLKLVGSERGGKTLSEWLSPQKIPEGVLYAVGPEGGWAESEFGLFETAGFHPVSLGARILRSETAAMFFAGIAQYVYLSASTDTGLSV